MNIEKKCVANYTKRKQYKSKNLPEQQFQETPKSSTGGNFSCVCNSHTDELHKYF